jgi:hypothetical protein
MGSNVMKFAAAKTLEYVSRRRRSQHRRIRARLHTARLMGTSSTVRRHRSRMRRPRGQAAGGQVWNCDGFRLPEIACLRAWSRRCNQYELRADGTCSQTFSLSCDRPTAPPTRSSLPARLSKTRKCSVCEPYGGKRTALWVFRYVAACDQYRNDHRHVPDGVFLFRTRRTAIARPGRARRIDPGRRGAELAGRHRASDG